MTMKTTSRHFRVARPSPFALSLSKGSSVFSETGFDPSSSSGQAKLSRNGMTPLTI